MFKIKRQKIRVVNKAIKIIDKILKNHNNDFKSLFHPRETTDDKLIEERDEFAEAMNDMLSFTYPSTYLGDETDAYYHEKIENIFLSRNAKMSYLPSAMLEDKEFIKKHYWQDDVPNFNIICDILASEYYDSNMEKAFLDSVGCSNIEDYMIRLIKTKGSNTLLCDCGAETLAACKLYGYVKAAWAGEYDVKININDYLEYNRYGEETSQSEFEDSDELNSEISINGFYNTLGSIALSLNHEITHVIQRKDIRSMNFERFPNIDIITKDNFLSDYVTEDNDYPLDYGQINYYRLSYEFSAENRGIIESIVDGTYVGPSGKRKSISGLSGFVSSNNIVAIDNYANKMANRVMIGSIRRYYPNENYKMNINDITDEVIQLEYRKARSEGNEEFEDFLSDLKDDYPLLLLEYHIDENSCYKKSVSELVSEIPSSDPVRAKAIKGLLLSRINPKNNPKTAAAEKTELLEYFKKQKNHEMSATENVLYHRGIKYGKKGDNSVSQRYFFDIAR